MNELSLFTGAGGGILGTHLLGWTPIGYVEWDDYCQRVLAARIAEGLIPSAPIFGDVREFVQSGAAEQYRGFADVVTAGFPCQPHSEAGKRLGAADERDMWPATRDCIRAVRPGAVVLENVTGILTGYAATVVGDLAALGYVGRTGCIRAADIGAPHLRSRWWVVAHAADDGIGWRQQQQEGGEGTRNVANADSYGFQVERGGGLQHGERTPFRHDANGCSGAPEMADAMCSRRQVRRGENTEGARANEWPIAVGSQWWKSEPDVGRVAHGVASRVDRLKAIGNGQVPRVVAAAWELLK